MLLVLAAVLVLFDQATKLWAAASLAGSAPFRLGLGFSFTYVENSGAAFGIFQGVRLQLGSLVIDGVLLLGMLSAVVALGLVVYLITQRRQLNLLTQTALSLVLAGAVGNMIDRFRYSYVIDFIHFQQGNFNFPVFNVADICVVVGAGLLLLQGLLEGRHERQLARRTSPDDAS